MMKEKQERLELDVKIRSDKLKDCQHLEVFGTDGTIKFTF